MSFRVAYHKSAAQENPVTFVTPPQPTCAERFLESMTPKDYDLNPVSLRRQRRYLLHTPSDSSHHPICEGCTLNELKLVIDCLAFSFVQADGHAISFAEAQRLARDLIMCECSVYHAAGAPYGKSLTGFLFWLDSAERLTPSA